MARQSIPPFIGRTLELAELDRFRQKNTASFIVVRGRRRIGKTCLIEEFGKHFNSFYRFVGLPPEKGVTAEHQLETFSLQIAQQFKIPPARYATWSDALWAVGEQVKTGNILLLFDEISWMGSMDPAFLGHIKNFWDIHLKKNNRLVFIICGSASAWIEKNILSSTGFLGRISYTLTLEELSLPECTLFWGTHVTRISAYEKLKVLAVTGGVPKYLEEINPKISAEENIKNLCFKRGGLLVNEFNNIFSDLFLRDSALYRKIVQTLVAGPLEPAEICESLGIEQTGRMSEYLAELELTGFIKRDYTWHIATGHDSKLSAYRLSDNYLRFYLKYIEPHMTQITRDSFAIKSLSSLPELATILGLQFENLVLNSRAAIHRLLGLRAEDIVCENPYFQRTTKAKRGCQIDYMIQTKFNTLYICEIKFSKNPVGTRVIEEVQQKMARLKIPRAYSLRPVLIHVNGVETELKDSDFFAAIIDCSALLRPTT